MKQKITDAEAFEAARTLHNYCMQYPLVMKTPAEVEVFRPDFEEIYIERSILKELEAAKK